MAVRLCFDQSSAPEDISLRAKGNEQYSNANLRRYKSSIALLDKTTSRDGRCNLLLQIKHYCDAVQPASDSFLNLLENGSIDNSLNSKSVLESITVGEHEGRHAKQDVFHDFLCALISQHSI